MAIIGAPSIEDFTRAIGPARQRLEAGFDTENQERENLARLFKSAPIKGLMNRDEGAKADVLRVAEAIAEQARQRKQQAGALAAAFDQMQRDLEIVSRF
jgi:hypothetical protein